MANPVNPKVTAATVGGVAAAFVIALVEWLTGLDVPEAVEVPFIGLATFGSGWIKTDAGGGRHARQ